MYSYIAFLCFLQFSFANYICDVCKCDSRKYHDAILEEIVDCSRSNVLNSNYTLPSDVYSLDLSWNKIDSLYNSSILISKSLKELYLNDNNLKEIGANILILPELNLLDLSFNQLESIHEDTFKSLNNLQYLNLSSNKFKTFEKLTFHRLSNLIEIVLDNNDIGESLREVNLFDKNGFGLTKRIEKLSIRNVNLNKVPDNFFLEAYNIRKVVISKNNLTEVFELPFTLEYLDISDNPIRVIFMEDFLEVPALRILKLNNLQIHEVPEYAFAALHGLVDLELERNSKLTEFSALAFGREVLEDSDDFVLETLSLKGSRLRTLSKDLMEPFGHLLRLDLEGNPWRCDCNLVWLKDLQIHPDDYDNLRCASPSQLHNSRIFDLDARYFCPSSRHYVGLIISAICFCITLAATALWLFICLPRYQSRCSFIREMYTPSTAYSVLPMTTPVP